MVWWVSQVTRPPQRLRRWAVLPRVEVLWSGLVLEMWYVPSRATWQELEALVTAERAACPWLVWGLSCDRGWPLVRIEATSQDAAAVAAIAFVVTGGAAGPAAVLAGRRG